MHRLLEKMTTLLYQIVGRCIKEDQINECKTSKDPLTLNVSDAGTQMKLKNIDYGTKTKKLNKRGKEERNCDTNERLLGKYGNKSTEISSFRCFPLDVPEMFGSCKSQKDNISSKDKQIGTVVTSCYNWTRSYISTRPIQTAAS